MDFANFQQKWGEIIAKSWDDSKLHDRLISDATSVLREHGVNVPPGVQVKVVQDTANVVHLAMPAKPSGDEIAEEELAAVAGGRAQTCCFSYNSKPAAGGLATNPAVQPANVQPAVVKPNVAPAVKR